MFGKQKQLALKSRRLTNKKLTELKVRINFFFKCFGFNNVCFYYFEIGVDKWLRAYYMKSIVFYAFDLSYYALYVSCSVHILFYAFCSINIVLYMFFFYASCAMHLVLCSCSMHHVLSILLYVSHSMYFVLHMLNI